MAAILLINYDVGESGVGVVRDALVSHGHTVTIDSEANALGAGYDFAPYDVVMSVETTIANRAAMAALMQGLEEGGKPIMVGPVENSATGDATADGITTTMGWTGQVYINWSHRTVKYGVPSYHEIIGAMDPYNGEGPPINWWQRNTWYAGPPAAESYIGVGFITCQSGTLFDRPIAIAIEQGTARLTSGSTVSRAVMWPLYVRSGLDTALEAEHIQMLGQAVDWLMAEPGGGGQLDFFGQWQVNT